MSRGRDAAGLSLAVFSYVLSACWSCDPSALLFSQTRVVGSGTVEGGAALPTGLGASNKTDTVIVYNYKLWEKN